MTRNVASDCWTACTACCGGEMTELTKLTENTRNDLLMEASNRATAMGANAIVGIRLETNTIFEGMLDMVVSGTAVKIIN